MCSVEITGWDTSPVVLIRTAEAAVVGVVTAAAAGGGGGVPDNSCSSCSATPSCWAAAGAELRADSQ